MQSIKRRISIGKAKTCPSVESCDQHGTVTILAKMRPPLRRSNSIMHADVGLGVVREKTRFEFSNRDKTLLPRVSGCHSPALLPKGTSDKESKENGTEKYSSLAKMLSGIAQLSHRRGSMHRNSALRSSLPAKQRRDFDTNENAPVGLSSSFAFVQDGRRESKNELLNQSSISLSHDSAVGPSTPCDSVHPASFLVSPTRYDALDDEVLEDSLADNTGDFIQTAGFSSFTEVTTSPGEGIEERRLSIDLQQVLAQNRNKETKKESSKWRRIASAQMRMWSHRRNTIESEDAARRPQNMLRVSSSGRISLRQKHQNNADNRLSLFGNTAESLLTLMQQPEMLQAFRSFLKSEYSEENLDFWLECEHYRTVKPQRRKKIAARIYATYLDVKAPREINIDAGTRARTEHHLENPKENTFEEAQRHIFDLMERDSFRRFITSDKAV